MNQNKLSHIMANKSDSELMTVLDSPKTFVDEARLAAALELQNRGKTSQEVEQLISQLSNKIEVDRDVKKFEDKLFSKASIYLWAYLITPVLVGPFMAYNIWELGNRRGICTVLGLTAIYIPYIVLFLSILPDDLTWLIGLVHLAYGTFFVEWTWGKYLPSHEDYQKGLNK